MKIDKENLIKINKKLNGNITREGSLEFAISMQKNKKIGEYKKLSYLWRAILVDHPFTDGNKRSAVLVAIEFANQNKKGYDEEKLVKIAIKISKENIINISKIERKLKNAIK
ncbi:MAG: Fic family protein [Nanoarchaeota archaeon]|nr:Fic family protein [Nanoarchaeota archaeon]MBU0962602.1 Fic family protein [Nanoarchaeota archaeon]